MILELPNNKSILFGNAAETGLHEAALTGPAKAPAGKLEEALGSLAELVGVVEANLDKLAKRPDKVEMEFGATLSGDCKLWIVSGKGEAEFKVTLSWGAQG
jgi:hypothetical protein